MEAAAQDYLDAVKIQPKSPDANLRLGLALVALDRRGSGPAIPRARGGARSLGRRRIQGAGLRSSILWAPKPRTEIARRALFDDRDLRPASGFFAKVEGDSS